jgi:hypothetical protein
MCQQPAAALRGWPGWQQRLRLQRLECCMALLPTRGAADACEACNKLMLVKLVSTWLMIGVLFVLEGCMVPRHTNTARRGALLLHGSRALHHTAL